MTRNMALTGLIAAISLSFSAEGKASWGPGQGDFRNSIISCIDSVGEWGEDFFCIGFKCQGSELQLIHISSSGDFSGSLRLVVQKGRGAEDSHYDVALIPDYLLSERSEVIVESSPINRHLWQDIMRSHTITIGISTWSEYSTIGLESYTDTLTSQCQPH